MWTCGKCGEKGEANFDVCWKCGTPRDGIDDPAFRPAEGAHEEEPATAFRSGPAPSRSPQAEADAPDERDSDEHESVALPEYEFSPQQNEVFGGLASAMKFVGICLIIVAILHGLAVTRGNAGALVSGFIYFFIGIWTIGAAGSFRKIVDTQGRDITNLMAAITSLRSLYHLQRVLIIIGLVVILFVLMSAAGRR